MEFSELVELDLKAKEEEKRLAGKIRAASLGHPDWENICVRCGNVEIPWKYTMCPGCAISSEEIKSWVEKFT
jgi:hypothetical protein